MKIDLEVLASTSIKRKKPWPQIIWIGEEQESLLLLDAPGRRISVLYVPSGKTKRRLPKLSTIVEHVLVFNSTKTGGYLLGILHSGEIFIWQKDKDVVRILPGLEKIAPDFLSGKCQISASEDVQHVLVTVGPSSFYLWVMEKGEPILLERDVGLKGSWHKLSLPNGIDLPSPESTAYSISTVFYQSQVLGECCQCSVIYNKPAMLSIATLILKFPDPVITFGKSVPIFSYEWSLLEYPFQQMHPEFEAISSHDAYISGYCGNGQVLAVAANQRHPSQTAMLFVSPLTDTVLVGGMRGCGVSGSHKQGRQYWVHDLAWSYDCLFVACMMKNGSVCVIPRLGDPIIIQTHGDSINMGPSYYLPLHPAITVSDSHGSLEPSPAERDPMQQQFSLATHPSLPIILFSDGFLVTVLQLPVEMTCVTFMRDLVIESAKYLKKLYTQENLDMTVADAYKLSKGKNVRKQQPTAPRKPNKLYEFELAEISLNATAESEISITETANKFGFDQFGAIGNLDAGKIVFGEPEMISIDLNATFSGLEASESLLKYLEECMSSLTLAWKLAASYSDIWTSEVDNIAKQAIHNLSKVFSIVLDCPTVDSIIPVLTPRQSSAIQNPRVYNIIVAYRNVLQLLRFDTFNQHLIPAALRLIHKTIVLMLTSKELEKTDSKLKTLFGCFSLLKHAETSLNRVYVWVPSQSGTGTPTSEGSPRRYEPAVMMKLEKLTTNEGISQQGGINLEQKGQLPGKRLAATWKLLYKHGLEYESQLTNIGDPDRQMAQLEKLLSSIQQTLVESDAEVTPRRASAKLSSVWLRHAFPFGLMSESDSFLLTDELDTSIEPKSTYSLSPNQSTHVNSTLNSPKGSSMGSVQVNSTLTSPKESTGSTLGNLSPSTSGQPSTLRVGSYSSSSRGEFSDLDQSAHSKINVPKSSEKSKKFEIFSKIRAAVSKPPKPNSGTSSGSMSNGTNGTNSTVQVGSGSSSTKESSSSSGLSFFHTKPAVRIRSLISSMQDNDSPNSTPVVTSTTETTSSIPIIMLDILNNDGDNDNNVMQTDMCQPDISDVDHYDMPSDMPKSEGFDVLEGTQEFIVSQIRESQSDQSEKASVKQDKSDQSERSSVKQDKSNQSERLLARQKAIRHKTVPKSDKLSVGGSHSQAINAWKEQLKLARKKDSPKTAKMLHSVLYTHLLNDELGQAVDFIDSLILQARVDSAVSTQELPTDGNYLPLMTMVTHRSQDSEEEELVPCVRNKSIRHTVHTMARFMAAYFSNGTMFIYPPHSAQALPAVHMDIEESKSRIIPKYHEDITSVVTHEGLSSVWTTERCVEYLLLSGLVCETVWFAYKMGDWKTAFLLSVAHTSHREIAQHLYLSAKKPLQLPESLMPHAILREKLTVLISSNRANSTPAQGNKNKRFFIPINQETNMSQLTRTLQDILTAGIICDVELAPWLLGNLVEKLKVVVAKLQSIVPRAFYLPAPPLYCPQPGEIETGEEAPDVEYEKELRMEISSIIQLILVSLDSAHLSLSGARWYVQELFKIQERAAQFKATTEGPCLDVPEVLQQYKILRCDVADYTQDVNVHSLLTSFRDFCSLLWLLHVRDELSLHLRKRGTQLSNKILEGKESPVSTLGQEYVEECFKILKCAVHMLSFSHYLSDDGYIRKVILSLILELPATEDTADILAEHFYAADSYDAETQEKLERLLSAWQSVEILPEDDGKSARLDENTEDPRKSVDNGDGDDEDDESVRKSVTFYQASPRAKTLSVYFHKQCEVVQKVLKKRRKCFGQYEEFVFSPEDDYDDTLQSNLNQAGNRGMNIGSRPFETKQSFMEFLDRFYAICFSKIVEKESEGRKPVHSLLMQFSKVIRESEMELFISKHEDTYQKRQSSVVMASPRAKFFRSQSESQVSDGNSPLPASPQKCNLFRSNSSGDVQQSPHQAGMSRYESEGSLLTKNSGRRPPASTTRRANMTGMASRFYQSEEVLYHGDTEEAHWILDVNFGQRYLALQQLLDYLRVWCGKSHSLDLHGKSDKDLGLKPTMRIEVPTQLVILSLWLLEHKYSSAKVRQLAKQQRQTGEMFEEEKIDNLHQQAMSKQKGLATLEEITEHDSFTQVSNIRSQRSRSHSPKGHRSRSHSADENVSRSRSMGFAMSQNKTLDSCKSINTSQEETELRSAYKKALDGGDDSSSLEVSSLEPDDYGVELKHSLSALESERSGRSRSKGRRRAGHTADSPDNRNNSSGNHSRQFAASPERGQNAQLPPQTSTPSRSPSRRQHRQEVMQADVSHISLVNDAASHTVPPGGQHGNYRGELLGGDPSMGNPDMPIAGMDLAQQLQHIVRGELRRMMQVQHQSMMAMMGALDGQPAVAMQPEFPTNQNQVFSSPHHMSQPMGGQLNGGQQTSSRGRKNMNGAMRELRNLQEENQPQNRKSKSSKGKENVDSTLRMSAFGGQENIEVYRMTNSDPSNINFVPKFLRMNAERDNEGFKFPHIPQQAWGSQEGLKNNQDIPDMPLLHVERTVPANVFPETHRNHSLPKYVPQQSYFQPPLQSQNAPVIPRTLDSPDSGIGIPLLRIPTEQEQGARKPRFGELLPPDVVIETAQETRQKEILREKYLREYHQLQAEQSEVLEKQRFGEELLHLNLKSVREEEEPSHRSVSRATSPRKSPRKTPRSLSEQISSKKDKIKKKSPGRAKTPESHRAKTDEGEEGTGLSGRQPISEQDSGEEAESEDEDATEAESVMDEEVEEEELHDGFAFTPGEFEAYLALEKQLAHTKDTHARIQLKTALRLQQQRIKEKWRRPRPKVDFATNTAEELDAGTDPDYDIERQVRTTEKATSITKDTGVDPIHEAVIEYNKSRQANVLPPDIYMGLRFTEAGQQPSSDVAGGSGKKTDGRNYLNVVDLDASAILNDLKERPEGGQTDLDTSLPPTQQHIRHRIAQEDNSRSVLEPPVIQRPTRADDLTVRLFETRSQGHDNVSIAVLPREGMSDSKYAVMQRLRDMNTQLEAIDRMSNNMEREFHSTRLAINTLDHMTEAMEPATKRDRQRIDQDIQEVPERLESPSPRSSAKSPTPSARATARSTGRSTTRTTARSRPTVTSSVEDKKQMSVELARMSGLSGISDIIGDMVAKGDIDLNDVGLTEGEANRLVQRGAIRREEVNEVRVSLDEIKKMASATTKHGGYDRDTLHTWMADKRHKHMEEHRRQMDQLREKETRPFRPTTDNFDQSLTVKERKALSEARQDSRKANSKASMTKRMGDAQSLLGDILTDKPELPKDLPPRMTPKQTRDRSPGFSKTVVKTKTFKKDTSPARKTVKMDTSTVSARKPQSILKTHDASPPMDHDYGEYEDDVYMNDGYYNEYMLEDTRAGFEPPPPAQLERVAPRHIMVQPTGQGAVRRVDVAGKKQPGIVPKLKLGLDDVEEEPKLQQTGETTGELSEYYRAVQAMDVSDSQERSREVARQQSETDTPTPQKTFKVKPYTEIVKVQRPQATRKKSNKFAMEYVGRLNTISQSETSRTSARTDLTQREQQMIYGSKRLPQKKATETTPRRVKTYAERLQEMKSQEKYSTPIAPRSQYGSSVASASARSIRPGTRVIKPPHKPVTYVEQLQKLNQGHHKPKLGTTTTVVQKPMIKSHKPPHKPKTYAQQLQDLQPTKHIQGVPVKRRQHPAPSTRPYRDPYATPGHGQYDHVETDSLVSMWSVGDDVRNILYDDVDSSIAVGQSASYAPSEQMSDYFTEVMGNDYTASVDIDELVQIADGGSMSSGSMMSFIDWDQVDDLIADI